MIDVTDLMSDSAGLSLIIQSQSEEIKKLQLEKSDLLTRQLDLLLKYTALMDEFNLL